MSLLFDDILTGRVTLQPPLCTDPKVATTWQILAKAWKKSLPQCQVFRIGNVSTYYWEQQCQTWDMTKDFPNLAPPFKTFWMEFEPPVRILEGGHNGEPFEMKDSRGAFGRTGVLLIGGVSDEVDDQQKELAEVLIGESSTAVVLPNEKFSLGFVSFCQNKSDKFSAVTVGAAMGTFRLDIEGRVLTYDPMTWRVAVGSDVTEAEAIREQKAHLLRAIPAFLAVSLLHCKNVPIKNNQPESKVSRKFQKKTGKPLTSFKVLEIEAMKRILRHEGQSEFTGLKKALHVCRGHFKDYREHGIGRYHAKGLWWWDDHVRGTISEGVADKHYDVKPRLSDGGNPSEQRER